MTRELPELKVKLKLDLHVHVFEQFFPMSPQLITISSVKKLIDKIKSAGLDGVAITEHDNKEYGYRVKEIVDIKFGGEILIIPGREVSKWPIHYIELDLAADRKTSFRFIAHPGYPGDPIDHINGFKGIEIENGLHAWHIDKSGVESIADKHNLILLSNSDAHYLHDVGKFYTEISLEDLGVKMN